MTPTEEQQAILRAVLSNEPPTGKRKSYIINAVAGSGKSTTCKMIIQALTGRSCSLGYTMFNTATVQDFKVKMGQTPCKIGTAHSFGMAALRRKFPTCKLNEDKLFDAVNGVLTMGRKHPQFYLKAACRKLVELGQASGIGIPEIEASEYKKSWRDLIAHHDFEFEDGIDEDVLIDAAERVLKIMTLDTTCYTFAEQLYLPMYYNASYERFDYLMVDENQDTNLIRMFSYERMLKPWGALIAVGDEAQSIYGWQGAGIDAMQWVKDRFKCESLNLTECFRCDQDIVAMASRFVPQIRPSKGKPPGEVVTVDYQMFCDSMVRDVSDKEAVLCRFNAPLVDLALKFVSWNKPVLLLGKDLAVQLSNLDMRFDGGYDERLAQLEVWFNIEYRKVVEKGNSPEYIYDRYQAMRSVYEHCRMEKMTPGEVQGFINYIFARDPQEGRTTFSTVHKAKGREWPTVYLLGWRDYMPSKFVPPVGWQMKQEENLQYVAITRAMHNLVLINNMDDEVRGNEP